MLTDEPLAPDCRHLRDSASDYLDGHITDHERAGIEGHLDTCLPCANFFDGLQKTVGLLSELREGNPSEIQEDYVARAYDEYYPEPEVPHYLEDWTAIKLLWGELAQLAQRQRAMAIQGDSAYLDPNLCDWLLGRARRSCSVNPDGSVSLAQAAVEIARVRNRDLGDSVRLVRSLVVLARCLVVLQEFPAASETLQELGEVCSVTDVGPEERAQCLATQGLYYSQTGESRKGELCLARALDLKRIHGTRKGVICELVNLAATMLIAENHSGALRLYQEATGLLDTDNDPPRLQHAVHCQHVLALCEVGNTPEARALLPTVRDLSYTVGGWYARVYTTWLEGTLASTEGRLEKAAEIFESVRAEFETRGHLVWYVEASLDLARVRLAQGRLAALGTLASELIVRTGSMRTDKRVKAAVVRFAQLVRQRSLSNQVISSIAIALNSVKRMQRP